MEAPLALLKIVAKASLNAIGFGVAGELVVEVLPSVARDVWGWWSKERSESQRRADIEALAAVPSSEMDRAVKQVVAEVAADKPPEVKVRLANYINMMPGAVRASLRRPSDPKGVTVPPNLPLQKAEDLIPFLPQRLPRFNPGDRPLPGVDRQLVKLLGTGGFGEVWRARNPHLPNLPDVALKFCLDPTAREQLLKHEATVLARVQSQGKHPGIVPLLQSYLSADPPCLEYELVEGGDLAGAIYAHQSVRGPLEPRTASQIVKHLARAVGHLHKLNPPIVHRDLKPANVLVRRRPDGKNDFLITDFGIGGVVASQALTQTVSGGTSQPMLTALRGAHTPLYASPEQKRCEPPDPRDDVHALGVIWYQLLVGDFSVGSPTGGAWRKTLTLRGLSEPLLHLLESCLETQAEHRPADAFALAETIDRELRRESPITVDLVEQDVKEALEEWRTKGSCRPYFVRQGPSRISAWQAAAQQGKAPAQWLFARCLREGTGVAKDDQAAVGWLWQAAESGLAFAESDLGDCYYDGAGVEKDSAEAFRCYTKAAEQGFAEGQKSLGVCYAHGEGVAEDLSKAVQWCRKAADQGWAEAQNALGDCYREGTWGVAQDQAEAVRWYRKAAESGCPEAQVNLGLCYDVGEGVEKNPAEAAESFRKAAEQGHPEGQDYLGDCYFLGDGVEQDYPQAISWYRKAAEQALARAQFNLGECYDSGKGVKRDFVKAAEWYRKAADQGYDEAQFALGNYYRRGRGVEPDRAQAKQWYQKAADQEHAKAKNALKRIEMGGPGPSDGDSETNEFLAEFRKATRNRGWQERAELLRTVAQELGYQRLGPKIRETLESHLRNALHRKIVVAEGDLVRAGNGTLEDYDLEDLRGALCSIVQPGRRYEREEVIQEVVRYFGFVRVTENVLHPIRGAINSAIRRGIIASEGTQLWRADLPLDSGKNQEETVGPIPEPETHATLFPMNKSRRRSSPHSG